MNEKTVDADFSNKAEAWSFIFIELKCLPSCAVSVDSAVSHRRQLMCLLF